MMEQCQKRLLGTPCRRQAFVGTSCMAQEPASMTLPTTLLTMTNSSASDPIFFCNKREQFLSLDSSSKNKSAEQKQHRQGTFLSLDSIAAIVVGVVDFPPSLAVDHATLVIGTHK